MNNAQQLWNIKRLLYRLLNRKPGTRSAKHNQSEERKAYQRHQSGKGALQQPTKTNDEVDGQHMLRNDPSMQTASALITGRQYSSEDYEEIIRDLKRLNAKQASEVNQSYFNKLCISIKLF